MMRRFPWLLAALLMLAVLGSACEHPITITGPASVDTLFVRDTIVITDTVPVLRIDTLLVTHVDTVPVVRVDTTFVPRTDTLTRVDTVIRVDTLASPPVHDTTIVTRVDTVSRVDTLVRAIHDTTFVPHTDTLFVPSPVVHDTSWVYVQGNPTNPFAGGDALAGVAYIPIYETFAIVFWHGHFVGVVQQGVGYWRSYVYSPGQMVMPQRGDFPTLEDAVRSLVPVQLILTPTPTRLAPSAVLLRAARTWRVRARAGP